ncbi:hypothetical protein TRVA0_068S00320 [Trichomonascus vanleenenianus]|uniref:uncharacterized protein n=1 Tax=Trichomonascus vanleenenianus TaxID=2268995 RepID=UPI003ECA07C4
MVSKLSVVSLALAITGALGQTCTLSVGGSALVKDINTLSSHSNTFAQTITSYQGYPGDTAASTVYSDLANVISDMQVIKDDFTMNTAFNTGNSDCDISAIISAFNSAAPSIIDALTAIGDYAQGYLHNAGGVELMTKLTTLVPYVTDMLTSTYSLAPCDIVGQTSSLAGQIADALATCQESFNISPSNAPTQPAACSPTSPPTCSKKQKKAN